MALGLLPILAIAALIILVAVTASMLLLVWFRRRSAADTLVASAEDGGGTATEEADGDVGDGSCATDAVEGRPPSDEASAKGIDESGEPPTISEPQEDPGATPTASLAAPSGTARQIAPCDRRSRPRGSGTGKPVSRGRQPRPEVVCSQAEWRWVLAVQVPTNLLAKPGLKVVQGDVTLERDEPEGDCWILRDANGEAVITWRNGEGLDSDRIALDASEFLLFRLAGVERRLGRLTHVPSVGGSYLAVVPETWQRDESRSGPAPAHPEGVSIEGWRAHFFDLTEASREIAFRKPDGQSVIMRAKSPKFDLVGNRLRTVLEDQGPFFAEGPPRIRAIDKDGWSNTGTLVIGEEGGGRGRRQMAFTPQAGQIEQDLPPGLRAKEAGWYFVRLYDEHGDLIESLDFRFANGVGDVAVDSEPLPSADGHLMGKVRIRHGADWHIKCAASNQQPLPISTEGDHTTIEVAPHPDCDRVRWRITSPRGVSVEAANPVGRLWWCLGEEGDQPGHWEVSVVTLSLQDFRAASDKAIWIRLPALGWTDEVKVGFTEGAARSYPVKVASHDLVVALRDFTNAPELASPGTNDLRLWSRSGLQPVVLGKLKVTLVCKWCEKTDGERDRLLAHVVNEHLTKCFPPLSYDEMQDYLRQHPQKDLLSLPHSIYQCNYCCLYLKSDDAKSPTSAIVWHLEQAHLGQKMCFRVVTDTNEIRQRVITNLPRVVKCLYCGHRFANPENEKLTRHLRNEHGPNVIEVR